MRFVVIFHLLALACFCRSIPRGKNPPRSPRRKRASSMFPWDCGTCPNGACVNIQDKVVSNKYAQKGHLPWQARLHRIHGYLCGGSIINDNWIVTAAHCILHDDQAYPQNMTITLGDYDLTIKEGTEQTVHGAHIIKHEDFNKTIMFSNDIALVRTRTKMKFNTYVRPICYPGANDAFKAEDDCVVSGWGSYIQDDGTASQQLRFEKLEMWDNKECNESDTSFAKGIVADGMICAGYRAFRQDDIQKCTSLGSGDSGGPFACKHKNGYRWTLAGIVSASGYCQTDVYVPGQFTQARHYLEWVKKQISASDKKFAQMDRLQNRDKDKSGSSDEFADFLDYLDKFKMGKGSRRRKGNFMLGTQGLMRG